MKKILSFFVLALAVIVGAQVTNATISNPPSSVSTPVSIANGGTANTSFLAPSANINPVVYYDGTKLTTNSNVLHLGYDETTDTVYSAGLRIANTGTTVATFTNTTQSQSATGGAGMIGYANPGTAMTSGSRLGFYLFGGATDTASTTANSSGLAGFATENWSGTNQGSRVDVYTTPNGATTASRRTIATFDQSGKVGIATTTPTQMLSVAGTVLANNYQATSTTEVSSFVGVKAGTKVNTDGATITVDWLQGPTQEVVLGATGRTLAFSNVQAGAALKLWVWQDATGSRTITTYPTGTHWAGGTAPTLTTTAGKFDILVFTTASSTTQFSAGASLNY